MTRLRLSARDDPLAIGDPAQPNTQRDSVGRSNNGTPAAGKSPPRPAKKRRAPQRRQPARARPTGAGPYDEDRLEQTGWRLYEGLLARVRDMSGELNDTGVPASTAALAAAVLHFHTPRDVEEAAQLMREWRKTTAGRRNAERNR